MDLNEFVNKIFLRFPPEIRGEDTLENHMYDYTRALDTGKEYNYDNAYIELLRNYSFKTTPPAKIVLEILTKNEIKKTIENQKSITWENILADINGMTYEFALDCPFGIARTNLEKRGFTNVRYPEPVKRAY